MKHLRILAPVALLTVLAFFAGHVSAPMPVQAQNVTTGPHTLQVTIGAGTNTQISTTSIPVRQLYVQNNAGHNIRVGDSATSSTRGALLLSTANGSITSGLADFYASSNLNQWYIAGTNGDVIDIIYVQ